MIKHKAMTTARILAKGKFTPDIAEQNITSISFSSPDIIRIGVKKREKIFEDHNIESDFQYGTYYYNVPRDFY